MTLLMVLPCMMRNSNDHSGDDHAEIDKNDDCDVDDDDDMMVLIEVNDGVLIMRMMRTATVCILSRTKVYDLSLIHI